MHRPTILLGTCLIAASQLPARPAELSQIAWNAPSGLTIEWEGGSIHYRQLAEYRKVPFWHGDQPSNAHLVACDFLDRKTKCWQLYSMKKDEPYGKNLKFVKPIAVLPEDSVGAPGAIQNSFDWVEKPGIFAIHRHLNLMLRDYRIFNFTA